MDAIHPLKLSLTIDGEVGAPLHYGEVEKIAESGQLWGLISPQFFLQKIRKILLNAVLTPQESLKNFVLKN